MAVETRARELVFRGETLLVTAEIQVCPRCGLEVADQKQMSALQFALSEAYKKKAQLLTANEIRQARKRLGWSQKDLAGRINVGLASIKRWETGLIQTTSMDGLLRAALACNHEDYRMTGGRPLSLPRLKLVIDFFEKKLGRELIKPGDKMLYVAKYVWYADMAAFRAHGRGMTGATYAALPKGPQLNNYRDLIENIKESDEKSAEPLTGHEKDIIIG